MLKDYVPVSRSLRPDVLDTIGKWREPGEISPALDDVARQNAAGVAGAYFNRENAAVSLAGTLGAIAPPTLPDSIRPQTTRAGTTRRDREELAAGWIGFTKVIDTPARCGTVSSQRTSMLLAGVYGHELARGRIEPPSIACAPTGNCLVNS